MFVECTYISNTFANETGSFCANVVIDALPESKDGCNIYTIIERFVI